MRLVINHEIDLGEFPVVWSKLDIAENFESCAIFVTQKNGRVFIRPQKIDLPYEVMSSNFLYWLEALDINVTLEMYSLDRFTLAC